ncbi:sugar phosphate isomerase/epimerase family protein [Haloarchaeobius sp. DFWS5]|uniref:sugar phosphate isomerase/epimerase family protein n=1 Tax=Haloarchaeobius sp. DFWS5 TaxID=3446114 RepID=UPI003EBF6C10
MQFGLCTISNKQQDVLAVLDAAAAAGYDGVEVWGGDHVGDGDEATCAAIRECALANDLAIPVYGSYLRPGTAGFHDELSHELRVADRLGADLVRVWAGDQEWQDRDDDHHDEVVSDLYEATVLAADMGLEVTVEKHEGTLTNTTEGARRVVEGVDHEACGLNYQPLFGMAPAELVQEARALAPLSNNVHVQAVPDRDTRDRCLLSDAFFDLEAVLGAFADEGYAGYVNVEFVTDDLSYEEAIERDRAYLTSMR